MSKCGEFGNVDGNITEGGGYLVCVQRDSRDTGRADSTASDDTTYASSLGAVDVDTFSMYASSDHIVPLDIFYTSCRWRNSFRRFAGLQ